MTNENNKIVSIIIVSYNNIKMLSALLDSILSECRNINYEIIIVDNNSIENNVEVLQKNFQECNLIINSENFGFGKACNQGAKSAVGKYLLFVNSDIIVKKDPIKEMIDYFETNPDLGILGAQLFNPDGSIQPSHFRFPGLVMRFLQLTGLKKIILKFKPRNKIFSKRFYDVHFVSGAFLMIEKVLFEKLNGFDEKYFMYQEDADLGFQIKKCNKRRAIFNSDYLIHMSENHENNSTFFVQYHLNRGHILFYKKNHTTTKLYLLCILSLFVFVLKYLYGIIFFNKKKDDFKKLIKLYVDAFFNKM